MEWLLATTVNSFSREALVLGVCPQDTSEDLGVGRKLHSPARPLPASMLNAKACTLAYASAT